MTEKKEEKKKKDPYDEIMEILGGYEEGFSPRAQEEDM